MGIACFTAKSLPARGTLGIVAALATLACVATDARAVTMIQSNSLSGQSWASTSGGVSPHWSDGQAAHAGADYEVDAGFTVRAPNTGSPSFPGNSLTMDGGQFNLSSTSGTTTTVTNLVLKSLGIVVNASANSTQTLAGGLSVAAGQTGFLRTGGTSSDLRNINVTATISGGGTIHLLNRGTVTLNNAANTFGGIWRAGGTSVTIGTGAAQSNASNVVTTLTTTSTVGSLGVNTSVLLDAFSIFDPDANWTTTGSLTINTSASLVLDDADQVLTVGALTIGGAAVEAGVYSYAQLNDTYGAFIADGGQSSASVVVGSAVPEPSSALVLVALTGVAALRKRKEN